MKRCLTILTASMALTSAMAMQDPNPHIRTHLNGVPITFTDVEPMLVNGRVMVPLKDIFGYLGAQMTWNQQQRVVTARVGDNFIWLPINQYRARVNDTPVMLDQPARVIAGRTMVPLRFVSESLGADVRWLAAEQLVDITMSSAEIGGDWPVERIPRPGTTMGTFTLMQDDVLPFTLDKPLASNTAKVGDKFTATLDPSIHADYRTLPAGLRLEGHIEVVRAKSGKNPGVLGMAFDRIRTPQGRVYPLEGELISLDEKSVESKDGRLVAKDTAKKDNLKYVGYGAGAGAILAIITDGNLLTNSLLGAALGFLYGEIQKDPAKSNDVTLKEGTAFGVRLEEPMTIMIPTR